MVEIAVDGANILGEVPLWSDRHDSLFWVDVRRPALLQWSQSSAKVGIHEMPELIGSFCETTQPDEMLVALKSGLYIYRLDERRLTPYLRIEPDIPTNRLNDGKCDRHGRFWVGSMNDGDRLPTGSLYRIAPDKTVHNFLGDIIVPNSLAWSPCGSTMYFSDTFSGRILAFDYDSETGTPSSPRVFRDVSGHQGKPDGSTMDADGCLWNAEYGGSRIVRYTPRGQIDRVVDLPVSCPTSLAFGGRDLDTLFITTARQLLSESDLASQPLAGAVLAIRPGTTGIRETAFGASKGPRSTVQPHPQQ